MNYTIFTDGSSRGNPGPGGWGAVLVEGDLARIIELGGGEKNTTNNRMELTAAAKAFTRISKIDGADKVDKIDIYTDSSYLINGITKWISGWKRNGWKTKTKDDVLNKDLWQEIDICVSGSGAQSGLGPQNIKWHHVGGHVGIAGNERCDEIATAFADSFFTKEAQPKLYEGPLSKYQVAKILDFSHNPELASAKSDASARSRAKAYSYISKVDGVVKTHQTWAECESRVRGVRGARYKKSLNREEEAAIIKDFS